MCDYRNALGANRLRTSPALSSDPAPAPLLLLFLKVVVQKRTSAPALLKTLKRRFVRNLVLARLLSFPGFRLGVNNVDFGPLEPARRFNQYPSPSNEAACFLVAFFLPRMQLGLLGF